MMGNKSGKIKKLRQKSSQPFHFARTVCARIRLSEMKAGQVRRWYGAIMAAAWDLLSSIER